MVKAPRLRAVRVALSLVFVMAPVGLRTAAACSCQENPPCSAAWGADAVFVGLVIDRTTERVGGTISWTVHKIAVNQTLKGSVDPFISIVSNSRPPPAQIEASKLRGEQSVWMNSCDFRFEVGQQYVIYARRTAEGEWTTSTCSGTKKLDDAASDLDYFATIPFADSTGRVYGTIERTIADPADPSEVKGVPAAGVPVALVSEVNRLTVKTDSEGKLDVQVPAGEYTVAAVVPRTIRVYGSPGQGNRVSVPSRGCAPIHFSLIANGLIEGRVVRADGSAVRGISVSVIPADWSIDRLLEDTIAPSGSVSGSTDENGRFTVDPVLPGRYVIAVNAHRGPTLESPYVTTYFPGVGREEAQTLELGEGERRTGYAIVVNRLVETTISGRVIAEDGQPLPDVEVRIEALGQAGIVTDSMKSDGSGAFQLRALIGVSYIVRATVRTESRSQQTQTTVFVDEQKDGIRLTIPR